MSSFSFAELVWRETNLEYEGQIEGSIIHPNACILLGHVINYQDGTRYQS